MIELAQSQIDILLDIKNNQTYYTLDEFDKICYEPNYRFLVDRKLIKNDYTEDSFYYFLVTPLGEIELDKYNKALVDEAKEDKRWKHTRLMAWLSIGVSIIAVIVACFT